MPYGTLALFSFRFKIFQPVKYFITLRAWFASKIYYIGKHISSLLVSAPDDNSSPSSLFSQWACKKYGRRSHNQKSEHYLLFLTGQRDSSRNMFYATAGTAQVAHPKNIYCSYFELTFALPHAYFPGSKKHIMYQKRTYYIWMSKAIENSYKFVMNSLNIQNILLFIRIIEAIYSALVYCFLKGAIIMSNKIYYMRFLDKNSTYIFTRRCPPYTMAIATAENSPTIFSALHATMLPTWNLLILSYFSQDNRLIPLVPNKNFTPLSWTNILLFLCVWTLC